MVGYRLSFIMIVLILFSLLASSVYLLFTPHSTYWRTQRMVQTILISPGTDMEKDSSALNVTGSAGKVNEINANDLKNILSKEKRPLIIDVSTPGEFREGHIHGSLLGDLRLLRSQPDQYLESLNIKKSDTIVLVCETGSKSYKVAEVMMRAGYQNVYNLKSGKIDWVRSGYELISGEQ